MASSVPHKAAVASEGFSGDGAREARNGSSTRVPDPLAPPNAPFAIGMDMKTLTQKWMLLGVLCALVGAVACGDDDGPEPMEDGGTPGMDSSTPDEDSGTPGEDAGTPPAAGVREGPGGRRQRQRQRSTAFWSVE